MRQLTEDAKTPGHVAVPSREGGGRHIEKYVWGFAPTSNDLPWILPVGLSVSVRASRVPAHPTTSAYLQRHVRTSTTTAGEVASSCDARDPASALKMLSSALREMMLPSVNRTRSLIARAAAPRASRVLCEPAVVASSLYYKILKCSFFPTEQTRRLVTNAWTLMVGAR
jgi:hypothetical protein